MKAPGFAESITGLLIPEHLVNQEEMNHAGTIPLLSPNGPPIPLIPPRRIRRLVERLEKREAKKLARRKRNAESP